MPRRPSTATPDRPTPGAELETPRQTITPPGMRMPGMAPPPQIAARAQVTAEAPIETSAASRTPSERRQEVVQRAAPAAPAHMPLRSNGDGTAPLTQAEDGGIDRGATAPQLRRFIKSRAYVPMHELRRRFAISTADDDVTPVDLDRRRVFVGLPEREGRLLGELLRGGDIGFELSLDPITPIVVGVYPMRPVTRA
jgi:hypothetical protein